MIQIGDIKIGKDSPLAFILGPCMIESEKLAFSVAKELKDHCPYPFIFKSSFDKANRLSKNSARGAGLKEGLHILKKIKDEFGLLVTTDVHETCQIEEVAQVVDLIQIPAFLSRQTDLIIESAKTGLPIHVKKGQFLAPNDMVEVVNKVTQAGNKNILLTERGVSFGYHNLVADMRSIPIMKRIGYPVCFDGTHSVQLPGGMGSSSGGDRKFIPTLTKAAIAAGADAIFLETHPDPEKALSDPNIQMPLHELFDLLHTLNRLHAFLLNETSLCAS